MLCEGEQGVDGAAAGEGVAAQPERCGKSVWNRVFSEAGACGLLLDDVLFPFSVGFSVLNDVKSNLKKKK